MVDVMPVSAVECWFLDVGQGDANIILLGGGRAIVVDSGPTYSSAPLKLLRRYAETIEALIVSHNDLDHDGGVTRILEAFPKAIKGVYYLADRPARNIRTYLTVKHEREAGNLLCDPQRIEAKDHPQALYSDAVRQVQVFAIYPTFSEIQDAEGAGSRRPNTSSAIICLRCGGRKVVFSGDASIEAWDSLASRLGRRAPLVCDIMTVPHHGGSISARRRREPEGSFEARETADLKRLYGQIIRPSIGVVSVGSSNRYSHPRPSTVRALRQLGIDVMCTQMTPQCCPDLEAIRPGLIVPRQPSESSAARKLTGAGRSRNVACTGSIVAEVRPGELHVSAVREHAQALRAATREGQITPLCVTA